MEYLQVMEKQQTQESKHVVVEQKLEADEAEDWYKTLLIEMYKWEKQQKGECQWKRMSNS